jgi:hypothetical protein
MPTSPDRIAFAVRLAEDSVEQRGLSGAKIAGNDRDGSLVESRLHVIVLLLKLKLVRAGQRRCAGASDGHFGFDGGSDRPVRSTNGLSASERSV